MKNLKTTMGAVSAALILAGCSANQQPVNQYTISGQVEGLADSTYLILDPVSHEAEKPLAEAMVLNGKFCFTDTISEPVAVYLRVKDTYSHFPLMVAPGNVQIEGSIRSYESRGETNYDLDALKVTGSPLTDKYHELYSVRDRLDSIYSANQMRFDEIQKKYNEAGKDKKKQAEIKASAEYQAMLQADHEFFNEVDRTYEKVFMDNKDTFWGPLMLISLTSYLTDDQKATYEAFSQEAKDSRYGRMVRDELYPAGKEGTKVPDFTVTDAEGKALALADLCKGQKYILIDFWASWCNPCRKEIPNLKKVYAEYAAKGFQIISISIDKKKADWEKALKEEQLVWPNFLDNGDVAATYKVKMIPTMYLIDANGILVAENLRGEALAEKLKELCK